METARKPMLIFDLDGTLWDSAAQVAESWNIIFAREPVALPPLTADDIHAVMGMTMQEISQVVHPSLPADRREEAFHACNVFEVEYLRDHPGQLYPDIPSVLETLISRGYTLAIVSNCQTGYVDAFLQSSGLSRFFRDYEEWERTGLVKGKNIRLVMERNGFDRAVYIGDTLKDQEGARIAGIPFIHAAYGFGKVPDPDAAVSAPASLPTAVEELCARLFR